MYKDRGLICCHECKYYYIYYIQAKETSVSGLFGLNFYAFLFLNSFQHEMKIDAIYFLNPPFSSVLRQHYGERLPFGFGLVFVIIETLLLTIASGGSQQCHYSHRKLRAIVKCLTTVARSVCLDMALRWPLRNYSNNHYYSKAKPRTHWPLVC